MTTTIHKSQQSPRLPTNHPAHVDRILECTERERRERRSDRLVLSATVACYCLLIASFIYAFL